VHLETLDLEKEKLKVPVLADLELSDLEKGTGVAPVLAYPELSDFAKETELVLVWPDLGRSDLERGSVEVQVLYCIVPGANLLHPGFQTTEMRQKTS